MPKMQGLGWLKPLVSSWIGQGYWGQHEYCEQNPMTLVMEEGVAEAGNQIGLGIVDDRIVTTELSLICKMRLMLTYFFSIIKFMHGSSNAGILEMLRQLPLITSLFSQSHLRDMEALVTKPSITPGEGKVKRQLD
jgi:hypothetical protein